MKNFTRSPKGLLIPATRAVVEWGNKHLVLSKWIFRSNRLIFYELEVMMLVITLFCIGLLFVIHLLPKIIAIFICILLFQRLVEFVIVYSRNFIFRTGRIFSDFPNPQKQGEWLIMMFFMNIVQVIVIFSIWYRVISLHVTDSFSQVMGVLDSLYFSVVTFLTVGYGDITPVEPLAKGLVLFQSILTFYILVIVINGLISIHFHRK